MVYIEKRLEIHNNNDRKAFDPQKSKPFYNCVCNVKKQLSKRCSWTEQMVQLLPVNKIKINTIPFTLWPRHFQEIITAHLSFRCEVPTGVARGINQLLTRALCPFLPFAGLSSRPYHYLSARCYGDQFHEKPEKVITNCIFFRDAGLREPMRMCIWKIHWASFPFTSTLCGSTRDQVQALERSHLKTIKCVKWPSSPKINETWLMNVKTL